MLLYHGSNADSLDRIMREGLKPRANTRAKDNWKHTVSSNRLSVYLTTTYAFHFAGQFKRGLIIEVDRAKLKPTMLYPDEDVLEQASRGLTAEQWPYVPPARIKSMEQRTRFFRKIAPTMPSYVDTSLDMMGTVGYYGTIPPAAFRRAFVIDWSQVDFLFQLQARDTMVSVLNYKFMATQHQALTRYFTLDPVTPLDLDIGMNQYIESVQADTMPSIEMQALILSIQRRHAKMAEAIAARTGITCVLGGEECSSSGSHFLTGTTSTTAAREPMSVATT